MITPAIRSPLLITSALVLAAPSVAEAQASGNVGSSADMGDIIVTARKRDETAIATPVVLTAIGQAELERRQINNVDAIARAVPQVIIGEGGGTAQGGVISIRGISGADNNAIGDQAVSFNIDGVQVARSTVRRMAEMDIEQIEVLKGPQALFFGKNSPGGIISIRSADPTGIFAGKASAGYEFNAHEWRGEGFVSGPLTDTLGARLAIYGSRMRGWSKNTAPRDGPRATSGVWGPKTKEIALRGTLKFDPSDTFDARLKISHNNVDSDGPSSNSQLVVCPTGVAQFGQHDCKADDRRTRVALGPKFGQINARWGDGQLDFGLKQTLASLEMNFRPTENLTLTSMTGYYHSDTRIRENFGIYGTDPLTAASAGDL